MNNLKSEVVIKFIGKLSMECPELDQLKVRDILEEVLYQYEIVQPETSLVVSDIEDKMMLYLQTKRLEGLSDKTLHNYQLNLNIFANCLQKAGQHGHKRRHEKVSCSQVSEYETINKEYADQHNEIILWMVG